MIMDKSVPGKSEERAKDNDSLKESVINPAGDGAFVQNTERCDEEASRSVQGEDEMENTVLIADSDTETRSSHNEELWNRALQGYGDILECMNSEADDGDGSTSGIKTLVHGVSSVQDMTYGAQGSADHLATTVADNDHGTTTYANGDDVSCDQRREIGRGADHSPFVRGPVKPFANTESGLVVNLLESIISIVRLSAADNPCVCKKAERMAGWQKKGDGDKAWRRDEAPRRGQNDDRDERFEALEEWRDSFTRRTVDTEEAIMERFRRLQIENDEMTAEMGRMRRQLRSLAAERPTYVTPILSNRGAPGVTAPGDTGRNGSGIGELESNGANERGKPASKSRPRAASFACVSDRSNEERMRSRGTDSMRMGQVGNGQQSEWQMIPKPRRTERKRDGARKASVDYSLPKPVESSLRDWLAKAKKDDQGKPCTPQRKGGDVHQPISPSWADEDALGELDSERTDCETLSPTSTESGNTTSPEGASAATRGRNDLQDCVDIYDIPPSGQTTEAGGQKRGQRAAAGAAASGHGGARPKTGGKMSNGGVMNNKGQNSKSANQGNAKKGGNGKSGNNGNGGTESRKVVTRNGWKTVTSKKGKLEKVSPRAAFPLRGKPATVNRDIYLQGLALGDGVYDEDVIESVRNYCIERGITPVFIRIIPVKFDDTRTGCRLTVSDDDYERVIMNRFWPDHIRVRDWTIKPKDDEGKEGDGARQPSDNEE